MEWTPVIFVTFKLLVLGIGMFFAIKWHYDQGKKSRKVIEEELRVVLRASAKVIVIFIVALLGVGFVTFLLAKALGMDLNLS
ncbi:MAG: hypothetical protein K2X55_06965 [Burkholderiaceae bacterium]|nr:hypothetical protein [Burkholderiaceae bacterium]